MYRKAGVSIAVPAIIAGVFSLIASALSLLRGMAGVKFAVKDKPTEGDAAAVSDDAQGGAEDCGAAAEEKEE